VLQDFNKRNKYYHINQLYKLYEQCKAGPTVIFPDMEYPCPLGTNKLYCLVTRVPES